ncbi:YdbL family protein [Moritella sp. F3]|uniref:YdbL family protein n=1 Tax=Moritella sp. F3 TaxID=2718882 RepID=UPI0018E15C22|nr:YdbL family protein [Moritella sp. F3]GIC77574.1 hypothetical protein FMO001_23010 [Moritella sp. F1]GIC80035.1 hypothetical protein FMO003_03160 [Moritella sp. F3]
MKRIFSTLIILFAMSFSVQAIDLQSAKQAGLVGEQVNGYLGAVKPSGEVNALIKEVNEKRKAKYQELATKHNVTVNAISARAAKKAMSMTEKGQFIESAPGQWKKK